MIYLNESIPLDEYPIGKVVWACVPFIKNGVVTNRYKERPVIVVAHFEDDTTDVVPVEEFSDSDTMERPKPRMGRANVVIASSHKTDRDTGVLVKRLNAYDVDLSSHSYDDQSGIYVPCKAVCNIIFNLENESNTVPCEVLENDLIGKIQVKYTKAIKDGYTVHNL